MYDANLIKLREELQVVGTSILCYLEDIKRADRSRVKLITARRKEQELLEKIKEIEI